MTQIPYTEDGSIPWDGYPGSYRDADGKWKRKSVDYREAAPFEARLEFHQLIIVRSGATVRMRDVKTGAVYPMKLGDFEELIPLLSHGALPLMSWMPYKRGSNYNIRRATEDD